MTSFKCSYRGKNRFEFFFHADEENEKKLMQFVFLFHWPPSLQLDFTDQATGPDPNWKTHTLSVVIKGGITILELTLMSYPAQIKEFADGLNSNAVLAVPSGIVNLVEV